MEMEMSGVQLAFDAVYVENNKTAHVVGNWIFLPLYLMDFPSSPVSRSDGIHQMLKLRIRLKASFINRRAHVINFFRFQPEWNIW